MSMFILDDHAAPFRNAVIIVSLLPDLPLLKFHVLIAYHGMENQTIELYSFYILRLYDCFSANLRGSMPGGNKVKKFICNFKFSGRLEGNPGACSGIFSQQKE